MKLPRLLLCALALAGWTGASQAADPLAPPAILQELRSFRQMGSVLYIAAHPDDENTQLIAYLSRGRSYRTAYLSLTRGDGGQNVLGAELDEELGVIRTQELLAARRIDGGRQFFTRAIDFGFSKDYRETLGIWDRQQVLADIVRVIRSFQPDVVITRFSPQPGNTHGHHTASAVLGLEAFKLAGDTNAFPEQLHTLAVWQPKRILVNGPGAFGRGPDPATNTTGLRLDVSGTDPVTGESFSEIAARSRSMHQTQGFANFSGFGNRGGRPESFQLLDGAPATNDILDGVDTTWGRVRGGAEIGQRTDQLIAQFTTNDPAASVPALLELRGRLNALCASLRTAENSSAHPDSSEPLARRVGAPVLEEKRAQLDRILQACLGLSVETTVPQAEAVPGETLKLSHTAKVSSSVPVRWLAVRYPSLNQEVSRPVNLRAGEAASREAAQTLPANTPLSQPYWLRRDHSPGMFRVDDSERIGQPENLPAFPIDQVFEVGGQTLVVPDEPVLASTNEAKDGIRRRLDVVAPVSLKFLSEIRLFAPGSARSVEIEATAVRAGAEGTLQLDAPAGWSVAPASKSFRLGSVGDRARLEFSVTAPSTPDRAALKAHATVNGARFDSQRIEIRYAHIPVQLLQPPARLLAVGLDLAVRGREVGYLPGAGDRVAECVEQMGYKVTQLTGADLTAERLQGFDAVIVGIRAFNVRTDLAGRLPALFGFVEAGGTLIEQYNRPNNRANDSDTNRLAPFNLHLSNDRVTDETAPMTFLAPDHPALTTPNRITQADFADWVQERGLYFPNEWDDHFTPLLACNDPGESPKKGGLLVAQYGHGYFVYTSLAWFRQLPAGVPGAYRLFANLVSLGKPASTAETGNVK